MSKYLRVPIFTMLIFGLSGCYGSKVYPLFDVESNIVPVPNDLMFAGEPTGDGTLYAGTDPTNPVITGLDHMDGASVIAQIDIPFSGSLDRNQRLSADGFIVMDGAVIPNPEQNVFLLPLVFPGGDSVVPTSLSGEGGKSIIEQPGFLDQWQYEEALRNGDNDLLAALVAKHQIRVDVISLNGEQDNVLRLSPLTPLMAETKYLLVVSKSVVDKDGVTIGESPNYALLSGDTFALGDDSISAQVRPVVTEWERLAQQYFSFRNASEGIALAYSFTTGGTSSVLESIASPSLYFEKQITVKTKQNAIKKLVAGSYNLSGFFNDANISEDVYHSDEDVQVNVLLHRMLTCESLVLTKCDLNGTNNPYYRATLAARIAAGDDAFMDYIREPSVVYLLQQAVADAAVMIKNHSESTIKIQASLMVDAFKNDLPIPSAQSSLFYRKDCLGTLASGCSQPLNPFFPAPAYVAQGQINLPYYLQTPVEEEGVVNPNPIE